ACARLLVPAKSIARDLSCTPRFVHMLAEQGKIPSYRFGRACIRFSRPAVLAALGITEAAALLVVALFVVAAQPTERQIRDLLDRYPAGTRLA
ncbi:MAG: hypothetical protein WCS43_13975, partial [Verrucomicrobiota bacterium]